MSTPEQIQRLVDMQAEDGGLFFLSQSIIEAYLQQELRRLHTVIEADEAEAERLILDYEPP